MIGYVTLGTNDLPRAAAFYDALAAQFGFGRMMDFETFIAWGEFGGAPGIAATVPFGTSIRPVRELIDYFLSGRMPEGVTAA